MHLIFSISLLHFIAIITPWMDIVLISKVAMSDGKKPAFYTALGIALGCSIWIILTLAGFNLLLVKFTWLQALMMIFGGLFLAKMGYGMILAYKAHNNSFDNLNSIPVKKALSSFNYFIQGLLTNLANPKAIIYFTSVFSMAIKSPELKSLSIILAMVLTLETFLLFTIIGYILSQEKIKPYYQKSEHYIDGIAGLLFIIFAGILILDGIKELF